MSHRTVPRKANAEGIIKGILFIPTRVFLFSFFFEVQKRIKERNVNSLRHAEEDVEGWEIGKSEAIFSKLLSQITTDHVQE